MEAGRDGRPCTADGEICQQPGTLLLELEALVSYSRSRRMTWFCSISAAVIVFLPCAASWDQWSGYIDCLPILDCYWLVAVPICMLTYG